LLAEEQACKTQEAFINAGSAQALTAALTRNLDPAAAAAFQALITTQFGSLSLNPSATSQTQGSGQSKGSKGQRTSKLRNPELKCTNPNCLKKGHTIQRCWAKGGGQEGKGPKNRNPNSGKSESQAPESANSASAEAMIAELDESAAVDTAWIATTHVQLAKSPKNVWLIDSGTSTHITPHKELFATYHPLPRPHNISTADHGLFKAVGVGDIILELYIDGAVRKLHLKNVLFAPSCSSNLVSISALTKTGFSVNFIGNSCMVKNKSNTVYAIALLSNAKLYSLDGRAIKPIAIPNSFASRKVHLPAKSDAMAARQADKELLLWHQHFNHLNFDAIRTMARNKLVEGMPAEFSTKTQFVNTVLMGNCLWSHFLPNPPQSSTVLSNSL
jgi:hypothetical protein